MTQLVQVPPFEVHWQSPAKYIQNLEKLHKLTGENILNIHKQNKNAPSVWSYNYHLLYFNSYFMFQSTSEHLDMCLSPLIALLSLWNCMFTGCAAEDISSDINWVSDMCCHSVSRQRLGSTGYVSPKMGCAKRYLIDTVCNSTSLHSMSLPPHFRLAPSVHYSRFIHFFSSQVGCHHRSFRSSVYIKLCPRPSIF